MSSPQPLLLGPHPSSRSFSSSSSSFSSSSSSSSSSNPPRRLYPREPQPDPSQIYTLYCDGASRGNPGLSGCGFVLFTPQQTILLQYKHFLGTHHTNNEAEYWGLIDGLAAAQRQQVRYLRVRADSMLVVQQTVGVWEVNAVHLRDLCEMASGLLNGFDWWEVRQVPREENKIADRLSNEAIDERSNRVHVFNDQLEVAGEEEEEKQSEAGAAATANGQGGWRGGGGGMRTKRLNAAEPVNSNDRGEDIILPIKRHRQGE